MAETERKSLDQLKLDRLVAFKYVQLGCVYRHSGGDHYVPKDIAYRESDMTLEVVYGPLKEPSVSFTRPLEEWKAKFKAIADPRR
jgi:hypothetical protein